MNWISTEKGSHLRARRTRDTAPEAALRKAVHAMGLRFRLHVSVLPRCTPDFVFPGPHVAVFVDGCYWHGCPRHSPREFKGVGAGNSARGRELEFLFGKRTVSATSRI